MSACTDKSELPPEGKSKLLPESLWLAQQVPVFFEKFESLRKVLVAYANDPNHQSEKEGVRTLISNLDKNVGLFRKEIAKKDFSAVDFRKLNQQAHEFLIEVRKNIGSSSAIIATDEKTERMTLFLSRAEHAKMLLEDAIKYSYDIIHLENQCDLSSTDSSNKPGGSYRHATMLGK